MTNRAISRVQPAPPSSMRPFLIIWTGQALSLLGSHLVQFALIWWLTTTAGSATALATASLVGLLPQVLLGPLAGVLADRCNRRLVIMGADGAIALATLLLALLYALGAVQLWHVYALLFVRALGGALHWPAMQASTTLMVPEEHLSRVAGLNQALVGLANILIPPLGALALAVLPMQGILAIDAATAALAIAPLLVIAIPQPASRPIPQGPSSLLADVGEALRFILGWSGLLLLSVMAILLNLLGRAAAVLLPLLVTGYLGGGAGELGLLQSAVGIGAVLGGITLGVWGGFRRRVVTSLVALALDGLAFTIVGLAPAGALTLVAGAALAVGFVQTVMFGVNGAIGQAVVPPQMQGRVFSLLTAVEQIAAPLGLAIAGPVADTLGVRFWWLLTGVIATAMALGSFLVPSIMHLEDRARLQATMPR